MEDKIEIHVDLDANKAYVLVIHPEPEDIDTCWVYYSNYSDGNCTS